MSIIGDVDSTVDLVDYRADTLLRTAQRIGASKTTEQMIYREAELDEVWRLIDMDRAQAPADSPRHGELGRLLELVRRAHDLVGQDEDASAAAALVQEAASLAGTEPQAT